MYLNCKIFIILIIIIINFDKIFNTFITAFNTMVNLSIIKSIMLIMCFNTLAMHFHKGLSFFDFTMFRPLNVRKGANTVILIAVL